MFIVGKTYLKQIIKDNMISALMYILGAVLSFFIGFRSTYFFPIWIPIGLSAAIISFKGIKQLPGIIIASLASNFFFGYAFLAPFFPILYRVVVIMIIVLVEVGVLYMVHWYMSSNKWLDYTSLSESEVSRLFRISFLMPFPLVAVYGWIFHKTGILHDFFISSLVVSYLGIAAAFLLFIPPIFAWTKRTITSVPLTTKQVFMYILITTLLGVFVVNHFAPFFKVDFRMPIYILMFSLLFTMSAKYPLKYFTPLLAVLGLIFLYKPQLLGLPVNQSLNYYTEILSFFSIVSIASLYAKGQKSNYLKLRDELKSSLSLTDDEIERQVNEYKQLNDKLFEEIEKRGIAERELLKSKRLLTEIQDINKISSWEYSIEMKKFTWIYHIENKSSIPVNLETTSLEGIIQQIHPDDVEMIKQVHDNAISKTDDFELEVRIRAKKGAFNYFFISGRSLFENGKITKIIGLLMDITERKLARFELEEKEQRYRTLFDSNIDPVCVIDAKSHTVYDVNPAFELIYGYNRDEIIGKSYLTLTDQPDDVRTAIAVANQEGSYRFSNMVHKRKQGKKFYVEGNLMAHVVKGNKMLFIISHDITSRKENELQLAEREQKFRSFFESDLIGMAKVSITKEWISFNEKLTQMLGYKPEELYAKPWDEITHAKDHKAENALFNKVLTHEIEGYTIEKRFIAKNSTEVFCKVAVKAYKTSEYNISHLIMMVDDISDRKRAEAELLESRTKLSQSQSVAKLGSIRLRKGFQQVELTPEAYEILGFGAKQPIITRKDFFKTILPGPRTRFEQIICDLENGLKFEGSHEQAFVVPSGDVKYLLINFGVLKDSSEQVTEVLATLADITRNKQAEIALKEANALKDQLFSIIGHDLRSPISSIKQLSELLLTTRHAMDESVIVEALEAMKKTSDETLDLLVNLLNWARSQQSETFKPVITDVHQIIDQVVSLSQGIARSKDITLHADVTNDALVMVDVEMLKTALRNLVSNSIKFTPNAGTVMINAESEKDFVKITISDTGVGIAKKDIPKLFDDKLVFTTPGTNQEKGTGLGLKMVKKFVEKNGGSISVESVPGQGTAFSLTFPKYIRYE